MNAGSAVEIISWFHEVVGTPKPYLMQRNFFELLHSQATGMKNFARSQATWWNLLADSLEILCRDLCRIQRTFRNRHCLSSFLKRPTILPGRMKEINFFTLP